MLLQKSRSKKNSVRAREVVCHKTLLKVCRFHKRTLSIRGEGVLTLVKPSEGETDVSAAPACAGKIMTDDQSVGNSLALNSR